MGTRWRATISLLALLTIASSSGCLGARICNHMRDEWRKNNGATSEASSQPKPDFGREKSGLRPTGSDRRAREIEASLGVGG